MLLLVTGSVNTVATPISTTVERCLRLQLDPPPPPPADSESRSRLDISRIICRDLFRSVAIFLRTTGKLPPDYVAALCHIFHDNEQNVERHVARTFRPYDFHTLLAGRTCATIRKRQHAVSPSPLSSSM
ncbi:hypothetical protein DEO72_LG11g1891 [Vigna unguiculata]|uniref:Uncharacterized protein n=1 Tax=Vigna unguiculata TaxID=3917 RepID=A0A4D6NRI4_VIGUN|nr:hypothetical protein DEO72_LG11g1891 [Vigna unguiculata]